MRWTIRRKLLVSIGLPLLITYLLVLRWDYQQQRENAVRFMQDMVLTRARLTAGVINTRLEQAEQLARAVGNMISTRPGGEAVLRAGPLIVPRQDDWVSTVVVTMERPLSGQEATGKASNGFVVRRMGRGARPGEPPREPSRELPPALEVKGGQSWIATVMTSGKEAWFGPLAVPGLGRGEASIFAVPVTTTDNQGVAAVVVPTFFMRRAANPMAKMLEDSEEGGGECDHCPGRRTAQRPVAAVGTDE